MNAESIAALRALLLRAAALALEEGKEYFVEARLSPLAAARGTTIEALIDAACRDVALATDVVEAMCVHETSWYRDAAAFASIRSAISLVAGARADRSPVRVWSAACSTGQEPYSVVMLSREDHALSGCDVRVTASDISSVALERARAATYSQLEIGRGLPAASLVRWFDRRGAGWVVRDEIRESVEFHRHNLARTPYQPPLSNFDVVLLRNVLIYFPVAEKTRVLAAVADVLAPHGVLVLGASETTVGLSSRFRPERLGEFTVFRPA